jgi:hypothetical protein
VSRVVFLAINTVDKKESTGAQPVVFVLWERDGTTLAGETRVVGK